MIVSLVMYIVLVLHIVNCYKFYKIAYAICYQVIINQVLKTNKIIVRLSNVFVVHKPFALQKYISIASFMFLY